MDGNLEVVKGVLLVLVAGAVQLVLPADAGFLVSERYLQRDDDATDSSRGVREDVARGMLPGFKKGYEPAFTKNKCETNLSRAISMMCMSMCM